MDLPVEGGYSSRGAGTRLYPLTAYVPKALIPIGSRYVIEYIIDYLKHHGIQETVILISQAEFDLLRNHLGDPDSASRSNTQ